MGCEFFRVLRTTNTIKVVGADGSGPHPGPGAAATVAAVAL